MQKVTILVPVYNEVHTLEKVLENINNAPFCGLEKEIILIDDASTDGSSDLLKKLKDEYIVLFHETNQGKGASLRTGLKKASGDIIVIQDADLEYNPKDYEQLIKLILEDKADVVYGSRFDGKEISRSFILTHFIGNKVLTLLTNILYNTSITDMETCYKAFKSEFIKDINIKSDRFDFEPEITAKILKKKARLLEVPISYNGREHSHGKKITWKDGIHAVIALFKFRFFD